VSSDATSDWQVRVVVPARDEEEMLPRCLAAVEAAAARLVLERPGCTVTVTAVLDSCMDDSARVVAERPAVDAVIIDDGSVGAARAVGIARATRSDTDAGRVWIANTDADSEVGEDWLLSHLAHADRGHEVVIGIVEPDGDDLRAGVLAAWRARHERRDGHGYVHGANLGFTLAAYRAAGGFPPVAAHEDVILVDRLRQAGVRWFSSGASVVRTSGRRVGRAPDGFSAYLRDLDVVTVEPTA